MIYRSALAMANNARALSLSAKRLRDKDGGQAVGGGGHHEESFEEFTARYGDLLLYTLCYKMHTIRQEANGL